MSYFSHVPSSYCTKNNLEEAIKQCLLKEFNRIVLDDTGLEAFKDNLLARINALNRQHKRCKPIEATWTLSRGDHGDIFLELPGIINFKIYKSI